MPILFQYRNIRHLLAMHITKQAEQEIYLIAQKKVTMVPPPPHKYTCNIPSSRWLPCLKWPGELDSELDRRLCQLFGMASKRSHESGAEKRKKRKQRDESFASLSGKSMFNHCKIQEMCC